MCRMNWNDRCVPRIARHLSGGRIIGKFGPSGALSGRDRPQQSGELGWIQAVAAYHRAAEQQYRNVQAVAAAQQRIAVDVDDLERRQGERSPEQRELVQHLLAQLAVAPPDERQRPIRGRTHGWRDPSAVGVCAFTCEAMKRTVAGGTSPTAVTL